jgi:predicted nuclease of restriction endonuclease-like (RecB) superfamily
MNYYNEIKENLINNEVYKTVKDYSKNKSDLETYYKVGKLLSEAGKHYGEGIIKEYSIKLTEELGKKYNITTLKRIRQFYFLIEKGATLSHQLLWSQYVEILPLKDIDIINYYIKISVSDNLSVRELRTKIKSHEYERLPEETKTKLINQGKPNIKDLVPNPIIINNKNNKNIISEKLLHQLILENILDFMNQLGNGYCLVGSEYKIKIGNIYNYIDLLLFNIEFNCYVVIELKVTELKKENIGQITLYMNYIDKNVKAFNHDKTIGIVIVKKNNKFVMEYCSDPRIIAREYIINN